MGLFFTLCCVVLFTHGATRAWATNIWTADNSSRSTVEPPWSQTNLKSDEAFVAIGDGSSLEFEFPENSKGVIVVSTRSSNISRGHRQILRVQSLDPEVLSILNVSLSRASVGSQSYIISIRSGFPGRVQLHLQLLRQEGEPQDPPDSPGRGAQGPGSPALVAERTDYSIIVVPWSDDPASRLIRSGGLSHFSEHPVLFALLPVIFVNKCAFGCKVEGEVLRGLLRRPVPLLLGVLGQFLVMPLYGYCVSQLARLPKALALGLVITCSAPGGGGGYLYSLLLGGDVTLAISMTLVSTVVAVGAMPLSSALYGRLLGVHAALHVPFVKILGTLLFIAIPISLGVLVKLRLPGLTRLLLMLIRPLSVLLMVGGVFMAYQMGASILANVWPHIVLVGVTVPVLGLAVGALLARLAGLDPPQRKTVSIEVGVQNSLLALAVMQLSFRRTEADFASQAPFIVALSSTSEMLLLVLLHLVRNHLCPPAGQCDA
ncbi:P3 protein [Boleophthalmus pectinirostris]|uniref:P3 protein n=1 Tax=Boleophthalmus pectinirostris TaxID=150288 RepID=UPI000A1C4ECC|nr:P3 protein [Boleophthalmus pectinirostris]